MASVNKPTNTKVKEADINRKLQIYGIISAFQLGKVPSNEQIDVALNSFLASRALSNPSTKLSDEGKTLVADVRDVISEAKKLLLSKNEGNLLQDFIWETQQFNPSAVPTPGVPIDQETAKQHGDKALEGFRTLGTLVITNGQFRKLLKDASVLVRDMAGDAATNVATKVKPSEAQLAEMDRPAEDNVWHDAPDLSKTSLKQQMQTVYKGSPVDDAKATVSAAGNAARQGDGLDHRAGLSAAQDTANNRINDNMDDESRDKALDAKETVKQKKEEYRRRAKEYFNRKMPQERKEQTIWRLKKMVLECQQHPDYQQAVETLLSLAEEYGGHGRSLAQGGTNTVKEGRSHLQQAENDLKTLIERFANGTSSDDFFDSLNQIYKDADNDRELKDWFKAMDAYIRKCLLQQGYILEPASDQEWGRLYDHGHFLLREKYRGHTDRVVDEVKFLADQFDHDAQNKAFSLSLQKLFTDLGNDQNGKPTFKPHLIKDLTDVILPAIFENVAYIPIPRIEYTDPQFDAVIENLVLESDNFTPNIFEFSSEHFFRWGRKNVANKSHQAAEVMVSGVQMDLRDVAFYVKRKHGFPSITDKGVADIRLAGKGLSFKMKMATADAKDSQNFFKCENVDVDIKNLTIKLKQSKHKLLFNLFKPIMLSVLRPAMQKAVQKAIKDQVNQFDSLLFQIKQEADRAVNEALEDPENTPNIYNRYITAVQKRFLQGKKKAQDVVADKKVNMAVTKEDSIFPSISLPGGISTKATEYRELARKGEKWESPVFSIGTANKSSDIPTAPKIERKAHQATHTGSSQAGSSGLNGHNLNGNAPYTNHSNTAYGNPTVQPINPATAGTY